VFRKLGHGLGIVDSISELCCACCDWAGNFTFHLEVGLCTSMFVLGLLDIPFGNKKSHDWHGLSVGHLIWVGAVLSKCKFSSRVVCPCLYVFLSCWIVLLDLEVFSRASVDKLIYIP